MKRLPLDSTEQERALLARITAAPLEELRDLLNDLCADELYLAQVLVGTAAERKVERDVEILRKVAGVVRWRFPRGWPSPASAITPATVSHEQAHHDARRYAHG